MVFDAMLWRLRLIWIDCFDKKSDNDWRLISGGLYKMDNRTEEIIEGREGLLVVNFEDADDPAEEWLSGLVCDDTFNSHAANLTCKHLGYGYAEDWGSDPENFQYLPRKFVELNKLSILIDDVTCSVDDTSITDCDAIVLDKHDCDLYESLWLRCSSGDDEEEEEGLGDLKIDFGGAKLSLNLKKIHKKWNFK